MKKIIVLLLLFCLVGCSSSNSLTDSKNSIKQSDIKGFWLQIGRDWSGDVTDLTNNPYAYLEITDTQLFFYSISFNEDEGYGVSEKYYKLEDNKAYYDYYELEDRTLEEISESLYGGAFIVSFDKSNLILMEYNNGINEDDGYTINTYVKIDSKDWPIEE